MVILVWECDSIWYKSFLINAEPIESGGVYESEDYYLDSCCLEQYFQIFDYGY